MSRLSIYSDLIKQTLSKKGFGFLSETTSKMNDGVLMNFSKNNMEISNDMIKVNCRFILDIRQDTFSVYLFA